MKKPKTAVIDGDILVYRASFWADVEGIDELPVRLKHDVKKWTPRGCKPIVALSCPRKQNFRRRVWPEYKAHRDDTNQPDCINYAIEIMVDGFDIVKYPQLEADDIMGIEASSGNAIAVTIDKDLMGCSGWHSNPNKSSKPFFVKEEEAYKFFCKQWMMGDATDCIPGLWRVGPKKAEKLLDEWEKDSWENEILEMYNTEKYQVKDPCGLSPEEVALAMARCVKILDHNSFNYDTYEHILWTPKSGS